MTIQNSKWANAKMIFKFDKFHILHCHFEF